MVDNKVSEVFLIYLKKKQVVSNLNNSVRKRQEEYQPLSMHDTLTPFKDALSYTLIDLDNAIASNDSLE